MTIGAFFSALGFLPRFVGWFRSDPYRTYGREIEEEDVADTGIGLGRSKFVAFAFHRPKNVAQYRREYTRAMTRRREWLTRAGKCEGNDSRVEHNRLAEEVRVVGHLQIFN